MSQLHRDPRVIRQYEALKESYDISTLGHTKLDPNVKGYTINNRPSRTWQNITKTLNLIFRNFNAFERKKLEKITWEGFDSLEKFDYTILNDITALPLLQKIDHPGKVWLDMHEYTPGQFENLWYWDYTLKPYYKNLLRKYKDKISKFSTVCNGIADEYRKEFGIEDIEVVTNAPKYYPNLKPSALDNPPIRLVHHGVANKGRKLEKLIDVMRILGPGYVLSLYIMANTAEQKAYLEKLKESSNELNIRFEDTVPTKEIPPTLNQYDIGLFYLEPNTINHKYALPNKIFEYVQSRLAIVVTPNVEMKKVVEEFDLGLVSENFSVESFAGAIKSMSPEEIMRYKKNSDSKARELSSDNNDLKIKNLLT